MISCVSETYISKHLSEISSNRNNNKTTTTTTKIKIRLNKILTSHLASVVQPIALLPSEVN
jgi:hypothetical protein